MFYIFSQHRSGSKLFCSLLDSHPDIECYHEANFNPAVEKMPGGKNLGVHLQYPFVNPAVSSLNVPIIHLYREDITLQAVSMFIRTPRADGCFQLPVATIAELKRQIKMRASELDGYATLSFSYEQMLEDKNLPEVLAEIGVRKEPLFSDVAQKPKCLPKNIDELYDA